jgi:hypothetical protein
VCDGVQFSGNIPHCQHSTAERRVKSQLSSVMFQVELIYAGMQIRIRMDLHYFCKLDPGDPH